MGTRDAKRPACMLPVRRSLPLPLRVYSPLPGGWRRPQPRQRSLPSAQQYQRAKARVQRIDVPAIICLWLQCLPIPSPPPPKPLLLRAPRQRPWQFRAPWQLPLTPHPHWWCPPRSALNRAATRSLGVTHATLLTYLEPKSRSAIPAGPTVRQHALGGIPPARPPGPGTLPPSTGSMPLIPPPPTSTSLAGTLDTSANQVRPPRPPDALPTNPSSQRLHAARRSLSLWAAHPRVW